MFKKIIAWALLITVTATVAVGGTLAYLTDRDSEANVFTTGDVSIDLNEDFSQGSELTPGVNIEKIPTISNTGKNDAYVWATVAVPGSLDEAIEFLTQNTTEWDWNAVAPIEGVEIEGKKYTVLTALYKDVLAKDAETPALFTGVALDKAVDIDPEGEWYKVNAGVAESLDWNNSDGNPVIYVSAYAIQTEGFTTVQAAFEAYQTQWGDLGGEYGDIPNLLDTTEELWEAAMTSKNHVVSENINLPNYAMSYGDDVETTINLNGYTVTVDGVPGVGGSGIGFIAGAGADMVFNGPGCVDMRYEGTAPDNCAPFWVYDGATVTVNGGKYLMGACTQKHHIFCQNSGKVIINDGEFITNNPNAAIAYCINGFIEINGGFFQNTANPRKALLDMGNNLSYINNQKITISGGTFVNWNPMDSAFAKEWPGVPALIVLAEGCKVISEPQANGDIWYTVVKG